MYCGRSFEQWSVIELKERLGALRLSKAGRKAELFVRLCEADPSELRTSKASLGVGMSSGENSAEQQTNVEEDGQDNMAAGNDGVRAVNSATESSIQERELDLLRRERDLVVRELEVLRIENATLRDTMGQRAVEREVPASSGESSGSPIQWSITQSVTAPLPQATVRQRPNINAICELLSEFKGTSDVYWRWEKQFKLLCTTYELDDRAARILVGMKLKDQALKWFHSKPEHLEISVEELLEEMRKMFDHRPARIILKRNFEKRVWQVAETFSEHFHDKVTLANQVPIEEEEIVDHLIEGISDVHLRNQAKIQRFPTKEALLGAFEQVRLEPEGKG
ncbi:uncharacterized protein [Temnothorax longispinosus]|uniref:uncharacterized protein n=1 Tax=Temnothorax longispinosus TaxID=300112 RepID=UPI003A996727